MIDRELVSAVFDSYVSHYDIKDEKIRLKVEHTYRVADISDEIARGLGLAKDDVDLAWFIGMTHDLGRFEQLKRYGTFSDAESIDHAHFAVELLFQHKYIEDYLGKVLEDIDLSHGDLSDVLTGDLYVIYEAVWNHSAFRIREGLDERTELFCKIIRDADKIDIFRVINETPMTQVYDFKKSEILTSPVTEEVMQAFRERHAVLRSLKQYPADYWIGHISLAFELEFPISLEIMKDQGYFHKLLDFETENPETEKCFAEIRECMEAFLA